MNDFDVVTGPAPARLRPPPAPDPSREKRREPTAPPREPRKEEAPA